MAATTEQSPDEQPAEHRPPARLEVLIPVPPDADTSADGRTGLGRSIAGVHVGLRIDNSWRSYFTVLDEWQRCLERDGAKVTVVLAGDRVGPGADKTRSDIDEWSRLIDVGVIGLGN